MRVVPEPENPPRTRPVNSGYGFGKLKKMGMGRYVKNGYRAGTGLGIGITHPISKFFLR